MVYNDERSPFAPREPTAAMFLIIFFDVESWLITHYP